MKRFSTYNDHHTEGAFNEKEPTETDDYNRVTRYGIDDPLAMSVVDSQLRMGMLHVIMVAYDIPPEDFIGFLQMLYPTKQTN